MKRLQCVQYMRGLGDMRDWVHQPFRILRSICGVDDDGPCDSFPNPDLPPSCTCILEDFYRSTALPCCALGALGALLSMSDSSGADCHFDSLSSLSTNFG